MKKYIKLYIVVLLLYITNTIYFIIHLKSDPANALGLIMLFPVYFIFSFIFGVLSSRIIRDFVISTIMNVIFASLIIIGSFSEIYNYNSVFELLISWNSLIRITTICGMVGYSFGAITNKIKNHN
ncbi:hypothetical protein [Peptostreptococcus faecalis]|uniref:hypothetical protein n=1 Tax=Peptostreptococcus faecalis TaxID=2045015 RepID=UPI000C7C2B7E|nr:hypothetical protein [Peptostreptococcus faecalis]